MNLKIAVISASPRQESLTIRAARFLKAELEKNTTHEVSLIDLRDWNTGYLQNVWETEEKTPEKFRPLYRTLNQSRAFILVTPEYNGMFSPAMNMVLDQFPKSTYHRKAFGIATASTGALGGMRAALHLQQFILGLFGTPSPQMLMIGQIEKKINPDGSLIDLAVEKPTAGFLSEFLWLAEKLNS